MASYGGLQGIVTGLTKSTDHPSKAEFRVVWGSFWSCFVWGGGCIGCGGNMGLHKLPLDQITGSLVLRRLPWNCEGSNCSQDLHMGVHASRRLFKQRVTGLLSIHNDGEPKWEIAGSSFGFLGIRALLVAGFYSTAPTLWKQFQIGPRMLTSRAPYFKAAPTSAFFAALRLRRASGTSKIRQSVDTCRHIEMLATTSSPLPILQSHKPSIAIISYTWYSSNLIYLEYASQ